MEDSKIEWTHHTFNPWRGCTKVSPGCAHCYAETLSHRNPAVLGEWGKGRPRVKAAPAQWRLPLKWHQEAEFEARLAAEMKITRFERPRVFCASLADWLDDEVPASWLFDLISLILKTENLNWLLLTKRPQNWHARLKAAADQCTCDPGDVTDRIYAWIEGSRMIHNVWIGTSVEDQTRANERIPHLLRIPARVRFLSCEPLLGPVDLTEIVRKEAVGEHHFNALECDVAPDDDGEWEGRTINWVIAGGESGADARPMHPDWPRSLRDQCEAAGVPFLFKQWGEYAPTAMAYPVMSPHAPPATPNDIAFTPVIENGFTRPYPVVRVGKKKAGRTLDGRIHHEFPAR